MRQFLQEIVRKQQGWVELRYHRRLQNQFVAQKGRVDRADSQVTAGVGVRVLEGGSWGFASTVDADEAAVVAAIVRARENARELAGIQREKIPALPAVALADADAELDGYAALLARPLDEKLAAAVALEREAAKAAGVIHTAAAGYSEMFEEKVVVTSDGAAASHRLARPELRVIVYASEDGDHQRAYTALGVTGGWDDLFAHPSAGGIVEKTARRAVDLLHAPRLPGGKATVILAPSLVGLLSHEAIGHTVEADFVLSGSVAEGKVGERVASELVTLRDAAMPERGAHAAGMIPFDDEGVPAQTTTLIEDGVLVGYLHNRETAARFGVAPTGNARAWLYSDSPLIRMRNTYIEPGTTPLEEIIAGTEDGFLLTGANNGQADATGEFMFGTDCAVEIKKGKLGRKYREATVSGVAFDVLRTVDAVSEEFGWELGAGYCGKHQAAKVDAGGPYLRCQATLGGVQ